ncbi:head GIN domain-containing protein [Jiulongibacter sp. NS-SX5]|uniref:head GIN domain-containing protein n=1 Tax=Jiulongibacter sp. NS-SX5 TaxID=3463854 RepID=UPI0040596585
MKKILLILLAVPLLQSCIYKNIFDNEPPGDVVEEIFNLDSFDEVDIGSAMNAVIIPSSDFRVTANGVERDVNDLNIRVVNRTLKISYIKKTWLSGLSRERMDLTIELPILTEVDISGASKVEVEDFTLIDELEADVSGASKLTLEVPVDDLEASISGASNLNLEKQTRYISADISGASKLNAFDADSEEVKLDLSGASKANVSVSDYLNVTASGASTVNYKGSPKVDQDVSGGSKVRNE